MKNFLTLFLCLLVISSLSFVALKIGGWQKNSPSQTATVVNTFSSTHPADTNGDFIITSQEQTAYTFCWKTVCTWPTAPSPVLPSYQNSGVFIWKTAPLSKYHYDSNLTCPQCYVNGEGVVNNSGQTLWLRTINADNVISTGVATDPVGNIIVAGYAGSNLSSINFGDDVNGNQVIRPLKGDLDGFVAKYTPDNHVIWANTFTSNLTPSSRVNAVATDSTGNVFVTGYFNLTVDFGGISLTAADPGDTFSKAIFVVKYNSSGQILWAKRFGSTAFNSFSEGKGIAVDGQNVFVTGTFPSFATRDDVVIMKLSGVDGHSLWQQQVGSDQNDVPKAITVDSSGNAWVVGAGGLINFGNGFSSEGGFIAKYSTNGTIQWAKGLPTATVTGIATDPNNGNFFATGGFNGSVDFGAGPVTTSANGGFFLAAYDATDKHLLWSAVDGAPGDSGNAVGIDHNNHVAFTGSSQIPFNLGGGWKTGFGYFVASFNTSGIFEWNKRAQVAGISFGAGVAFDSTENVYTTGTFRGPNNFEDGFIVPSGTLNTGFIAKYKK